MGKSFFFFLPMDELLEDGVVSHGLFVDFL